MRPKTYEALHILLGLTPKASAAEMILAADRDTGKTQHALDTLLRLRTQNEHHAYESTDGDGSTDQDSASFTSLPEDITMNKTGTADQQESVAQLSDDCTHDQAEKGTEQPESDPNHLQPSVQSRGPWKSLRNTLKHRASTLFGGKAKTLAGLSTFKSLSPKVSSFLSHYSGTADSSTPTLDSSPTHLKSDTIQSPRKALDIIRGGHPEHHMPIVCGLQVGGGVIHLNCPPPCRNTTTLTQFPRFPDDPSVDDGEESSEDNDGHNDGHNDGVNDGVKNEDNDAVDSSPVDVEDDFFDRALLEDIFNRSRRLRARKTVFGLFSDQN